MTTAFACSFCAIEVSHTDVLLRFRAAAFAEKSEYFTMSGYTNGQTNVVRLKDKRFFSLKSTKSRLCVFHACLFAFRPWQGGWRPAGRGHDYGGEGETSSLAGHFTLVKTESASAL